MFPGLNDYQRQVQGMKAPFSPYLSGLADAIRAVVERLGERYDYVSALATDSVGWRVSISQHVKSVSTQTMTTERGCVVRVYRDGLYSEAAFNEFDTEGPQATADALAEQLDRQLALLRRWTCGPMKPGSCRTRPKRRLSRWKPDGCPRTRTWPR